MQDGSLCVSIPCTAIITLSLLGESGQLDASQILAIHPGCAKPGAVITAIGMALGREKLAGLFLSDRYFDWEAEILAQSENAVRFRIPECARPGRQRILLLSAGDRRALLEQSVTIEIE
jgi:hypothetical protein